LRYFQIPWNSRRSYSWRYHATGPALAAWKAKRSYKQTEDEIQPLVAARIKHFFPMFKNQIGMGFNFQVCLNILITVPDPYLD
jgi:hypothetical protein